METLIDTSIHFVSPYQTKLTIDSVVLAYKKDTLFTTILTKL